VLFERTRDIAVQAAVDRRDESIDEIEEPDAVRVSANLIR
jgi:hypothetical protein